MLFCPHGKWIGELGTAQASMGDGILALENDGVVLPACAGGATCTAEIGWPIFKFGRLLTGFSLAILETILVQKWAVLTQSGVLG